MSLSKGSLETRPWLPPGTFLGFTSQKTEMRGENEFRVGRVVVVRNELQTLRDKDGLVLGHEQVYEDVAGPFETEAHAEAWAKEGGS